MSNQRRKDLVEKIRYEGYLAALNGTKRSSCPYYHMDRYQWMQGFSQGESEVAHVEKQSQHAIFLKEAGEVGFTPMQAEFLLRYFEPTISV
jgi:ribosome modulation factor